MSHKLLLILALLAAAALSNWLVRPGQLSINGARPGMTRAEVEKLLGPGQRKTADPREIYYQPRSEGQSDRCTIVWYGEDERVRFVSGLELWGSAGPVCPDSSRRRSKELVLQALGQPDQIERLRDGESWSYGRQQLVVTVLWSTPGWFTLGTSDPSVVAGLAQ